MISKLIKIIATGAILSACIFNTPNAQAMSNNGERMAGVTVGVGGDIAFAINENQDFVVSPIAPIAGNATSTPKLNTVAGFAGLTFDTKLDQAFGGNVNFGYLMTNGLLGEVELGYRTIKNTDKVNVANYIKSDIFTAMLNGTYFADFGTIVSPYITVGAGFARTNASGVLFDVVTDTNLTVNELGFSNLKSIRLAYQAGAGLTAKVADNAMIGVGYKFFGTASTEFNDNDYTDLTVNTSSLKGINAADGKAPIPLAGIDSKTFKFGALNNNIQTVTVFAKFVM